MMILMYLITILTAGVFYNNPETPSCKSKYEITMAWLESAHNNDIVLVDNFNKWCTDNHVYMNLAIFVM